jgi:hypothetical protein
MVTSFQYFCVKNDSFQVFILPANSVSDNVELFISAPRDSTFDTLVLHPNASVASLQKHLCITVRIPSQRSAQKAATTACDDGKKLLCKM